MRLRPHRRNLVVWSQSAPPPARYGGLRLTRTRRIPGWIRIGALLTVIGLVGLARGVRARWRPLLPGVVLTAAGAIMRSGAGGVLLLPGMLLLVYALLIPASPEEDRRRLEHELGSTPPRRSGTTSKRFSTGTRTASRASCATSSAGKPWPPTAAGSRPPDRAEAARAPPARFGPNSDGPTSMRACRVLRAWCWPVGGRHGWARPRRPWSGTGPRCCAVRSASWRGRPAARSSWFVPRARSFPRCPRTSR